MTSTSTDSSASKLSAPNRYRGKRQRTRQRLLDAAMTVLAVDGVDGTTVGKVAAEAGVVPGTIYHHFGGREDLVAETLAGLASTMDNGVAEATAVGGDPAARLALAAAGLVERAIEDRRFASAFGRLAHSVPELRQLLRSRVTAIIAEGVAVDRFVVPSTNLTVMVDALLAVAASAALNAAAGELSRDDRSAVARLTLAIVGLDRDEAGMVADEACATIDGGVAA